MTDLQIFNSPEFGAIRTIEKDGEPWFVGKDVATILGYAKPLNALATHIDEDDSLKQGLTDNMGRMQETIFINESGLYSLVLSSKLPNAKKFKRWVTSEVIPSIRKTGSYSALDMTQLSPEMQMLKLLTDKAIATELAQKQQEQHLQLVEQKVEGIRELVGINPNQWREDCRRLIVRIANRMGGNEYIRDVNAEVFQQVDERAGVSLATRLTNKRRRMADEGVCKSKRDKLTKVDVIAEDRKLVEIYIKVVRELAVRYEVV